MEEQHKQISKFNKIYIEMQKNLRTVVKMNEKNHKIHKHKEIQLFIIQLEKNMDLYKSMDTKLFEKVLCLYKVFGKNTVLDKKNTKIVWEYLNVLYTIATGKKQEEVKPKEPLDLSKMTSLVNNLMNDESNGFKQIVDSISKKLESSIGDKDVDQTQILQDLMSGKLQSNGIDFNEIISTAATTLKEKIDSGEVDKDNIKNIASQIKENINL